MDFVEKHNFFITLIISIIILAGSFYWFEYRPSEIKKKCWRIALSTIEGNTEKNYLACLGDHGLAK